MRADCLLLTVLCRAVRWLVVAAFFSPGKTQPAVPGEMRVTPAQAAGLTDHCWTFDELLA